MIIISPNTKKANQLARACGQQDDIERYEDADPQTSEILQLIETSGSTTVVIGPDINTEVSRELAEAITAQFPFVGIVVFSGDTSAGVRAAFRSGATDVANSAMKPAEVAKIIEEVQQHMAQRFAEASASAGSNDQQSRVMTVLSPRGGVGRTIIATGLAATLERRLPGEVVLVDLDLQCGDVGPLLGITPSVSIASVSGRADDINSADVKAILSQDDSGLHVLAAPTALTAAVSVTPELVAQIVRLLSVAFRFVIIDTGPCLAETTLSAIDQSTELLLVTAPDVPSVRALGRATDALDELKVIAPQRHLIINKATDRYGMPLRDIEAVSGMSPTGQLPAAKEVAMAINRGNPFHEAVHPRSAVAKALSSLANDLAPDTAKERRSLLGRLR